MFETTAQKLVLIGFIVLIISIPSGSFLLHQRFAQGANQGYNSTVTTSLSEVPNTSPLSDLVKNSTPASSSSTPLDSGADVSYGPTLKFAVSIEGRPPTQQQGKFFVGIAQGSIGPNPNFLISFTVNVPNNGVYSNLSLAGLTVGQTYTAYIKGPAQITTASTFTMSPTGANLNSGVPLPLITGDVNQDNVIDNSDYTIVKNALGQTSSSPNWNPNLDFDMNGVINSLDLAIITKNLGKTGDGGAWYSKIPPEATNSASINSSPNIGGEQTPTASSSAGYWLWVPSSK